ncbi:hypothetical protein tinsulaeT_01220 [Thalassotalea insulae]|uniref:PhoD-like phosphatase metallophosphatase domain-containing protein n=1 Tax=Thalassotalea insulae TaxID=2056778 RepID=A0ABQ6GLH0_9GAMM|nr:alkaline phosphatase D family protein [Thalassotalea insulae]GLX76782.1 hypothetical protein tinsulaeT_01220 [Thalassotalea insulae]
MKLNSALLCLGLVLSAQTVAVDKIYFGSCAKQYKEMPIFDAIVADDPDVFIFLGDNIYGDTQDMAELKEKYQTLGKHPGFNKLKQTAELIAIWDDHDFGENDAGKEYPKKQESRQLMLDFWQEPKDSPRYQRDGIYTSYFYGEGKQKVQVILPDLRWNRDRLHSVSKLSYVAEKAPKNMGPYIPSPDKGASMLGEAQWQWLEQELLKPAAIKVIGSSLQLLPEFTGWEAWANFPEDRQRLLDFIVKHKIPGVILISGDTHWGEVSYLDNDRGYGLWEVTSSGLSEEWKDVSPNQHRIGAYTHKVNYGFIEIDWQLADPQIAIGLKNVNGDIVNQHLFRLSSLQP